MFGAASKFQVADDPTPGLTVVSSEAGPAVVVRATPSKRKRVAPPIPIPAAVPTSGAGASMDDAAELPRRIPGFRRFCKRLRQLTEAQAYSLYSVGIRDGRFAVTSSHSSPDSSTAAAFTSAYRLRHHAPPDVSACAFLPSTFRLLPSRARPHARSPSSTIIIPALVTPAELRYLSTAPENLQTDHGISAKEDREVRRALLAAQTAVPMSALDMANALPARLRVLPTGLGRLDAALDGGIQTGELVELIGPSAAGACLCPPICTPQRPANVVCFGVGFRAADILGTGLGPVFDWWSFPFRASAGKSQLCMHLAAQVAGNSAAPGKVIYIDTVGAFTVQLSTSTSLFIIYYFLPSPLSLSPAPPIPVPHLVMYVGTLWAVL